jgi:predicted ArsR family transcriptional regulator
MPPEPTRLDAAAVKVLAHPLRSRLLGALRKSGAATATTLAAELHTNTGATSYHLRRLEEVGLVADTGEGTGKQRLWRAAAHSHAWSNTAFDGDEDAKAALDWLMRDYHRRFDLQYAQWLDRQDTWPQAWRDVTGMTQTWLRVRPDQLAALVAEVEATLERYRNAGAADPAARRIAVWQFAFPLEDERH